MSSSISNLDLLAEFPPTPHAEWRKAAEESLDGATIEKKLVTRTPEGIDLQPIYTADDLAKAGGVESWPGQAPFHRGTRALGMKREPWLVAQELPYGTPAEFNEALKSDLARGQTAINLPIDVATRRGLDPDEAAPGEVSLCGLSLSRVADLHQALDGIDIGRTPMIVWAGTAALQLTGLVLTHASHRRIAAASLQGGVLADPLTEYARDGSLPVALEEVYSEMAALTQWSRTAAPKLHTVGVQGSLWADAGGTAVEELAFSLATGVDYLRALVARGVPVEVAAPRFLWQLSLGPQFFMEIAKLRAARLVWSRAVAAFGGDAAAQKLFIHGRTALWNKTTLDPYVNMLRVTSEAFSGVVGGVDSLHVAAFDETIREPDEFSRRIARNVQIILAEECHLTETADAAGGSWYVETLTLELARKAWARFQEVEKQGGMAAALRAGTPQAAVAKSAAAMQESVAKRRTGVIGVNLFPNLKEKPLPRPDVSFTKLHAQRAEEISSHRLRPQHLQNARIVERLGQLMRTPAEGRLNAVVEAFDLGATIGEVSCALRRAKTLEPKIERVVVSRRSTGFEKLRMAAGAFKARTGAAPKVWLANFGPVKQHKARADFSSGFFAAGGFEVGQSKGAASVQEAVDAAIKAAAPIVVLCSTDDTYPELAGPFISALKAARPETLVVLAGFPEGQVEALKAAGVDEFIHIRANCLALLEGFHKRLGISA
jgi:methylmalonyl-CoA mutase